jgi:hypothetical protein
MNRHTIEESNARMLAALVAAATTSGANVVIAHPSVTQFRGEWRTRFVQTTAKS